MVLFLSIIQGPLTGDKYEIFDGLKLGRTKGHIKLNDNKSSSLHAKISLIDNKFILEDQGSKNGIRVNNEKVTSVVLQVGAEFAIGDNHFQVEAEELEGEIQEPLDEATQVQAPAAPPPLNLPEPPEEEVFSKDLSHLASDEIAEVTSFQAGDPLIEEALPPIERKTWSSLIESWAQTAIDEVENQRRPLAALTPAINLVFLRGLQAETTWTLGYGPRVIGPKSFDLPIYEPKAPDPCFEILPTAQGIRFKTIHADQVLLNGKSVETQELKPGDQITIFNSLIEVEFIK